VEARVSDLGIAIPLQLWRTFLLTPFKLITVFLHETSHALACKLTCGDVSPLSITCCSDYYLAADSGFTHCINFVRGGPTL
jgi:hypothetical protein